MLSVTSTLLMPLLAQAGSGSSGFSGGGGGGGGGGYSGGGGTGGSGSGDVSDGTMVLIIVGVLVFVVLPVVAGWLARRKRTKARQQRDADVRAASVVAAEDDPKFDPERLIPAAGALVVRVQTAWSTGDRPTLAVVLGPDLLVEWERRLDDFQQRGWQNRVELTHPPKVQLVSIANRTADGDDRAVVHVQMPMKSWVETPKGRKYPNGQDGPQIELAEFWTLAWHPEQYWFLLSIEQDQEGEHHLTEALVLTPDQDPELAASARTELAVDDAAGDGGAVASLVSTSFAADARAAALDLSLLDDRFAPDLLGIAVDRAVAAWAEAIDGADDALERLAAPEAIRTLLYGADASETTRTVVRGPRVTEVAIESVAGGEDTAAAMEVTLRYRARWYREDRNTVALIEGSRDRETDREQRWRFELTADREHPWRLVSASA